MSLELETREAQKPVCLPDLYAMGLQVLAKENGLTETALMQKALDALFQQEMNADSYSAWNYLKESEAELGPISLARSPMRPINPDKITEIIGIRAPKNVIRRNGVKN